MWSVRRFVTPRPTPPTKSSSAKWARTRDRSGLKKRELPPHACCDNERVELGGKERGWYKIVSDKSAKTCKVKPNVGRLKINQNNNENNHFQYQDLPRQVNPLLLQNQRSSTTCVICSVTPRKSYITLIITLCLILVIRAGSSSTSFIE